MAEVFPLERRSLDLLHSPANKRLAALVRYAAEEVPYYRQLFRERGLSPSQVQTSEELSHLPVLSKTEILRYEDQLIAPSYSGRTFKRKTGGSTGMTLHFLKDADSLARNDAIMHRCYRWYGIDIGDRQVRFWGVPVTPDLRRRESLKDLLLNRIRISAFDITESSCRDSMRRIKRFRPHYFYGYTTAIYGFCLIASRLGMDLNELNLKAVICTAEKMYPHHTSLLQQVFRCPVVNEYGSTENGIIAFQCRKGRMHLMADHLIVEFLDESDRPVTAGQQGRIVITDLSSYAMPMIRYDIGDIGSPSDESCSCGVTLPVMNIVEGRKEDFIRTADGKLVHAAYLCYTLKDDAVHEFKMYQRSLTDFLVQIVKSPRYTEDTELALKKKLYTELGKESRFLFEYLDRIPRESSGKLRYFVSELPQSANSVFRLGDS